MPLYIQGADEGVCRPDNQSFCGVWFGGVPDATDDIQRQVTEAYDLPQYLNATDVI
jgi:hypothetical protein